MLEIYIKTIIVSSFIKLFKSFINILTLFI